MTDSKKTLTGKQARYLRSLAHPLKPLLQVGKSGITDTFIKQLHEALDRHELLKVKVIKTASVTPKSAADEILKKIPCHLAQIIGKTLILYKEKEEDPEIILP